tara:strand:+ start:12192 stop:13013 length:822 start_codon:yes stop_codon:yes gene_type:complete
MSRKRGKLSNEETEYIVKNVHDMETEDIALAINRTEDTVKAYIRKKNLVVVKSQEEEDDRDRLKSLLLDKAYWPELAATLFENEIEYFIENWISVVLQFGEDISHTEELFLQEWLVLNILQIRGLQTYKEHLGEINKLREQLEIDYKAGEDPMIISSREQQLAMARSSINQHSQAHEKLVNQKKYIADKLKATREDRRDVKANADTYWGYNQLLDDEKFRKQESREAELMKMAQEKALHDYGQYHTYVDKTLDVPFLTPETMEKLVNSEKNNE